MTVRSGSRRRVTAPAASSRDRLAPRLDARESILAFPPEARCVICSANTFESVHARLLNITKTGGHFSNDEADTSLPWFALRNITAA